MTEAEFADLIDCRFPYGDAAEWQRLVALGRAISPNAHFMTLEEICRPPASAAVTAAQQREMMRHWSEGFSHPVKDAVFLCATALIERRTLAADRVLPLLDRIAGCPGVYAALNIACFACDDADERVARRSDAITAQWRRDHGRG